MDLAPHLPNDPVYAALGITALAVIIPSKSSFLNFESRPTLVKGIFRWLTQEYSVLGLIPKKLAAS